MAKKKILFVCIGNSCRSQMAEGLMRHYFGNEFDVYSAGTHPSYVNPRSIAVMKEIGIDISSHTSKSLNQFLETKMDYIVTLCDEAKSVCVRVDIPHEILLHWSIPDPYDARGDDEDVLEAYRKARDDIKERLFEKFSN